MKKSCTPKNKFLDNHFHGAQRAPQRSTWLRIAWTQNTIFSILKTFYQVGKICDRTEGEGRNQSHLSAGDPDGEPAEAKGPAHHLVLAELQRSKHSNHCTELPVLFATAFHS